MLFQAGALFDSLPVWENVAFGLLARHRANRTTLGPGRTNSWEVGLDPSVGDLSPAELSGGMQKRVALARAIASQPDIMFFDEPTTGLDPIMGAVIDGLIVDCVKHLGSTAVAITHDMASARRIGDRAAMLLNGRIIWTGPAERSDGQRQPRGRSVYPRPARRSDPDGVAALKPASRAVVAGLLAAGLVMAGGAQAGTPEELVGLFIQACLPFAGDAPALRQWAGQTGLPQVPDPARTAFLHGAPGQVFDASAAGVKLVLVSSDDGICSAATDQATKQAVTDALEVRVSPGRAQVPHGDRA